MESFYLSLHKITQNPSASVLISSHEGRYYKSIRMFAFFHFPNTNNNITVYFGFPFKALINSKPSEALN